MSRTIVAVNAHPDDEALLMAGTLAGAAAAGDRVVLAVATDGALGDADRRFTNGGQLACHRLRELEASARLIGASRVVHLGWADSGSGAELRPDPPGATRFVRAARGHAAEAVAALLREENADLVIGYDPSGGYGHRDHKHLHHVVRDAAAATGTRLLEATAPREYVSVALDLATKVYPFPPAFDRSPFAVAYLPLGEITHHIDVRRQLRTKRAAMYAHSSQTTSANGGARTLGVLMRIPWPLYGLIFGREWFADPHRPGMCLTDIWQETS